MKRLYVQHLAAFLFVVGIGGTLLAGLTPVDVGAKQLKGEGGASMSVGERRCADTRLLTIPTWYRGLTTYVPAVSPKSDQCNIKSPNDVGGISNFIWRIALNIIEIVLQLIGYIAVGFVIFGGYRYMISAGSPDGMVKARKTITNALIGLVISLFSVAIVNLVAGAFK